MTFDVHELDRFILVGSAVTLLAILAVRLSTRAGLPSLLVYLLMGVALGEAGLGIPFEDYDLAACFAYSDSITDLPMLEAVGHPTAVNPDRNLRKEASARGWPILTFSNPVSLRARFQAPSSTTVAATAAVGLSALAAGVVTYSLLRRKR